MYTLTQYWNILNCSLLEHLVNKFGDEVLVADFEHYKTQLKSFRCNTYLRDFAVYLRGINASLSLQKLKKFVVGWHKSWDTCTLEDLERSRENITEKFFLPSDMLIFLDGGPGSINITFAVPAAIALSIKEKFDRADTKEFCRKHRIIFMCVDDSVYCYDHSSLASTTEGMTKFVVLVCMCYNKGYSMPSFSNVLFLF